MVYLGLALIRQGKKNQAKMAWERALSIDPENQQIRKNLQVLGSTDDE